MNGAENERMLVPDGIFRDVVDGLQEGVYIVDSNRKIVFWNQAAERISGFHADEVIGASCPENILNHVDEGGRPLCYGACHLVAAMEEGIELEERLFIHRKDGRRIPVLSHVTPIRDEQGVVIGASESFLDTTTQSASIETIMRFREIALLDRVTRLGNRRYTETTVLERLEELRRYGRPFGVLFVDIDAFQKINGIYGRQAGDMILKATAKTIRASLRPFDFVGRWGGDEFVAVVVNITARELQMIGERIRRLVQESPIIHASTPIKITASVGATLAKGGDTVSSLLKRADGLMHRSKEAGRNCVTA